MKRWNLILIPCPFMLTACVPKISDVPQDSRITLALSDSQESVNTRWWEEFHNPALLHLLTQAREYHTQNKLAKTHIEAAQNVIKVARAQLYPHASLGIDPAYNQTILHPIYALTQGSLDISYHLDFLGNTATPSRANTTPCRQASRRAMLRDSSSIHLWQRPTSHF